MFACLLCGREVSRNRQKKIFCDKICAGKYRRLQTTANVKSGHCIRPSFIKRYLIESRGHTCQICNGTIWLDKPIPLVMDHINGNPEDNSLDNLRLVCGNCDMQLPTYKSKNRGHGRHSRRQRYKDDKSY